MIPIGLYRGEHIKDNSKPYVFLKPPTEVKLDMKDRVFVLSAKQPKDTETVAEQQLHQTANKSQFNLKSKL